MIDKSTVHMQLQRAVHFIQEQARPLEKELYKHLFEGADAEGVYQELARYQNEDGGFGRALEPDVRCEESSVLATTVALQHLTLLGADSNSPLVRGAMHYLLDSYNRIQPDGWDIVPAAVDEAAHAPWWNYNGEHNGWGNPAIEIVGYMHAYAALVPQELLDELTRQAVEYINMKSSRKDFHELLCCLRFAQLVPPFILESVKDALDEMVTNCVAVNEEQWNGYCLTPVQAAESPNSIFADQLSESVQAYLPFMLKLQQEDGAWHPAWSWGQYEEVWPLAKQDWKGVITLEALRRLRAYGIVST